MTVLMCKWDPVIVPRLLEHGRVALVLDEWDRVFGQPEPEVLERCERVYGVRNFDSLDELAAVAVDLEERDLRISTVASFTEFSQYGAGYLRVLLDLDDRGLERVLAWRDKRRMKSVAEAAGVRVARHLSLAGDRWRHEVTQAEAAVGFPAVLKPVNGMGVLSTSRVDSAVELERVAEELELAPDLHSDQLSLEEYVDGTEYHVDALWRRGEPIFFSVARYFRPRITAEKGFESSYLLSREEHPDVYRGAERLHRQVNAALEIEDGATHFEYFERPSGELYFGEVATRLAGGPVISMLREGYGFDIRRPWADVVAGREPELALEGARPAYVCGLNIPPPEAGTIAALPDVEALRADPRVLEVAALRSVGDRVDPAQAYWCVLVIFREETEEAVRRATEELWEQYPVAVDAVAVEA
jgi:ATP-grasp domain/L-amino acid ligase C-terminal domain 2